jgi:hypothetical protein
MLQPLDIDLSWAPPLLALLTVLGIISGLIRWLVKHYLDELKAEFKPNGGGSMKDAINRLEKDHARLYEKIEKVEETNLETHKDLSTKIDMVYTTIINVLRDK